MTPTATNFALIGRSFPSESFERLYETSVAARRARRGRGIAWDDAIRQRRVWRGSGEPVVLLPRLPV